MTDEKQKQQEPKQEVKLEDLDPQEAKAEEVKGGIQGNGVFILE